MFVGSLRLVFLIPHARSLKDKRSVVRKIVERARAKFNASIAEVGAMDVHRQAVLGIAVVSNDAAHVARMLDEIGASMSSNAPVPLVSRERSIQAVNEHDLVRDEFLQTGFESSERERTEEEYDDGR